MPLLWSGIHGRLPNAEMTNNRLCGNIYKILNPTNMNKHPFLPAPAAVALCFGLLWLSAFSSCTGCSYNHQKAMGSIDNILGKVDTLMKKNRQVFGRTSAGRTAYRLRKRGGEQEAPVCIYRYDNDLQRQAVHAGNDNRRTV